MKNQKPLLIGDLAKHAGVKADTIRFYEKRGLLPKPGRATSGYRTYDEPALKQLRFIRQAQSLGFSLHEIKRILRLHGAGKTTCRCVMTESKLKELRAFRDALKQQVERWRRQTEAGGRMAAEFCALIESSAGLRSTPDAVRPVRVKRSASS
jgi:MerR family transcriptional regulator, copper efflux regulator